MKIKLLSDTHLEFPKRLIGSSFVDSILSDNQDTDLLVLAGDIGTPVKGKYEYLETLFPILRDKGYEDILFVPGNHDYYGTSYEDGYGEHRAVCFNNHVRPANRVHTFGKVKIIAATLWSRSWDPIADYNIVSSIADFRAIKGWSLDKMHTLFDADYDFIMSSLDAATEDEYVILVTHFVPLISLCDPIYFDSPVIKYFANCSLQDLVTHPKLKMWLYGHDHHGQDKVLGNVRFISNPVGYPAEPTGFIKDLEIQI